MTVSSPASFGSTVSARRRWGQLIIGVVCMVMIANLQYGWTFFVPGIQKHFGWDRGAIQVAFTLFVLFETWLVPIEGWFVDKYGPSVVIFIGGVLCAIGWVMNAYATSLMLYYIAQIIAGIGAGAVYGTCIGTALKWFPDKRGLAAGITAAGFGAGSALTVVPIQAMIVSRGFQETFFNFGIGQGVIICLLAFFLKAPAPGQVPAAISNTKVIQSLRQFAPTEIIGPASFWVAGAAIALAGGLCLWAVGLQFYIPLALAILIFVYGGYAVWTRGQPIFTLMYLMFVIVGAGGLMVGADRPGSEDRGPARLAVWAHHDRAHLRRHPRPHPERPDAAVFRLGVRPYRAREHHVHRLLHRGGRNFRALQARIGSGLVRDSERLGILRLGRNLQPLPIDLHRHVRHQIRHDQRRSALHRQGNGGTAGALHQPDPEDDRQLGPRIHYCRRGKHPGRRTCPCRPEALAGQGHRRLPSVEHDARLGLDEGVIPGCGRCSQRRIGLPLRQRPSPTWAKRHLDQSSNEGRGPMHLHWTVPGIMNNVSQFQANDRAN